MNVVSKSALRVQYDLRPAKQVERRMLVDALQRLAQAGFSIRDYQYTGMGSIYFHDFIVFHKLLGINRMLSIEHDLGLKRRVKFNCPYGFIETMFGSSTVAIPGLSTDVKHFLWLDYDEVVDENKLKDVYLAGSQLSVGSILVVTVDTESPDKNANTLADNKSYYESQAANYLGNVDDTQFAESNLHRISKKVILNAFKEGMAGRPEVEFIPLFDFVYADGHRMLSVGGMLGTSEEKHRLNGVDMEKAPYFRLSADAQPYEIVVPKLTVRERYLLDAAMPCPVSWQPKEFNLSKVDVESYREVYRFLPAYAELLL